MKTPIRVWVGVVVVAAVVFAAALVYGTLWSHRFVSHPRLVATVAMSRYQDGQMKYGPLFTNGKLVSPHARRGDIARLQIERKRQARAEARLAQGESRPAVRLAHGLRPSPRG